MSGPLPSLICGQLPLVKGDQRTWPDLRRRKPWLDGDTKPPGRRQIIEAQVEIAGASLDSGLQFLQGQFVVGESQPHTCSRVMALSWQELELPQPIGIGLGGATERQKYNGAAAERVGILWVFGNGSVQGRA